MQARDVSSSAAMGRRPASNPLSVQLAFRVDEDTGRALDHEMKIESKPGLAISRNDVARILIMEALAQRAKKRSK
jgi:hypothetical protein